MKTIFISYANDQFIRRQRRCAYTALRKGKVDRCFQYGPNNISQEFYNVNKFILDQPKGAGFWIWKPYIILDAMSKLDDGDAIIYCDSASRVKQSFAPLVNLCLTQTQGVLGFEVGEGFLERQWTKRDAFILTNNDREEFWNSNQLRGGTSIYIKNRDSLNFVKNWLKLVTNYRLVSDEPSRCNEHEFPDFQAHRNDQSLFSLLYKSYGYESYETLSGDKISDVLRSHVFFEPSLVKLIPSYTNPFTFWRM